MKKIRILLLTVLVAVAAASASAKPSAPKKQQQERIVVAYVCSWTNERLPDPMLMTHINYAFGHVNKTFDGVDVQNEPFLRRVVALREQNPKLKIMLSIGGWTSGNFSEMAADARCRMSFARDCGRIVKEYGLDGIDIDWEYPTSSEAGISSSPDDTKNFTLLMRDLRKVLGKKKLLTAATIADGIYIDFPSCVKYMDFVNIMAYDVANPPKHHTTLFRSPLSGRITVEEAVDAHIRNGVPARKLTLGMPLYGRGDHSNSVLHQYVKTRYTDGLYQEQWDDVGKVPYLTDQSGQLVWGFDDTRSLAAKCQFIIDRNLLGGMYWECTEDNAQLDQMRTIHLSLMVNNKATEAGKRMLVWTDGTESSDTKHGVAWLKKVGEQMGFEVDEMPIGAAYQKGLFDRYHLIFQLNGNPYALSDDARAEFQQYIDEARGSFYAMPGGEKVKEWKWYDDFTDSLRIAPIEGSNVKAGGKWCPQLWTNTKKHARTLFYQWDENLKEVSDMKPYLEMTERALAWLLHKDN
ncbi:MAG: glycosyl hydrolase family 18 [Prevotella sp.]|nr:glycosyl hydrolase family 18 [Prevotella sp.]